LEMVMNSLNIIGQPSITTITAYHISRCPAITCPELNLY